MELDILRCGYFTIGILTLVTWAGSLFLSFCLIFSNFPRQRKIIHVSSSPCCNLKWKYRVDFAFHGIFTSETSIENVMNVSLYMCVLTRRTWKCHFATKLKTRFCLSHLIKGEWLVFSLRQYCLDFSIFPMFTFQPHSQHHDMNYHFLNFRKVLRGAVVHLYSTALGSTLSCE